MHTSIPAVLKYASYLLKSVGIESFRLDAEVILAHVLGKSRLDVVVAGNDVIDLTKLHQFWSLIARRLTREPVAYLLGYKEFFGLNFFVTKDCLIPRPDTESVVEQCLDLIGPGRQIVFDLCTGSGAIAIALLKHRPDLTAVALDISLEALAIAQKNADLLGVTSRFSVRHGDLFAPLGLYEKADLIVSNPPYIASQDIIFLDRDIKDFEPHQALDGGANQGLAFYDRILRDAPQHLQPKGYLVLELGFNQKEDIKRMIGPLWCDYRFFCDLAGNTRGVVLQRC